MYLGHLGASALVVLLAGGGSKEGGKGGKEKAVKPSKAD